MFSSCSFCVENRNQNVQNISIRFHKSAVCIMCFQKFFFFFFFSILPDNTSVLNYQLSPSPCFVNNTRLSLILTHSHSLVDVHLCVMDVRVCMCMIDMEPEGEGVYEGNHVCTEV